MSCLFCKISRKEIPAQIVYEDEQMLAFHDIRPQAPTHILLIPRKHIATINEVADQDALLLGQIMIKAKEIAKQQGIAESGYRLVYNINAHGGQEVYHIHLHLLGGRQMSWPPG